MLASFPVLLMAFASAFGARDAELPGPAPVVKWEEEVSWELFLKPFGTLRMLKKPLSTSTDEEWRALSQVLVAPIKPIVRDPLQPIPGLTLRVAQDALPSVVGAPKFVSTFAGTPVLTSGPLSFEAGLQIPVFDDQPGRPEPEFLLQLRLQF